MTSEQEFRKAMNEFNHRINHDKLNTPQYCFHCAKVMTKHMNLRGIETFFCDDEREHHSTWPEPLLYAVGLRG